MDLTSPITIEQLTQLSKTWNRIRDKIMEMVELGVFEHLDTDRFGVCGVNSYEVSEDGKELIVNLYLYERGYGNYNTPFRCPVELFFLDTSRLGEYVHEREAEKRCQRERAREAAKRERRRQEYLKLKAEFEPEAADGSH